MFREMPIATKSLIIINVVIFIITALLAQAGIIHLDVYLGSYYPASTAFHFWQPFTHIFMHASISHLLFNMFALFMFGSVIEQLLGTKRFLILYFLSGMGAFILFNLQSYFQVLSLTSELSKLLPLEVVQELLTNIQIDHLGNAKAPIIINQIPSLLDLAVTYISPMVGASGAIYGVLIAYGFIFPNAKLMFIFLPFPIKAKYFIPGIIIIEIILGLMNLSWNPTAHFAHIGGAITGFALTYYWYKRKIIHPRKY